MMQEAQKEHSGISKLGQSVKHIHEGRVQTQPQTWKNLAWWQTPRIPATGEVKSGKWLELTGEPIQSTHATHPASTKQGDRLLKS